MKKTWNEDSICEFLSAVEEIPAGIIASYVRIARLIGKDRYARPVGKALHMASFFTAAIQV